LSQATDCHASARGAALAPHGATGYPARAHRAREGRIVIEVAHLTKNYGDVEALAGLSLRVAEGEIYGLLYATFFESADKAAALGSLIAVAISALGGCWWPVEITPVWMRSLALLLPTGWAMNGIFRVMAFDATISGIAAHLAVFFGSALLCAAVAARRLLRRAAALPGGETA
jgi:hypothetical protein